jgi:hypothetical protein
MRQQGSCQSSAENTAKLSHHTAEFRRIIAHTWQLDPERPEPHCEEVVHE